MLCKAAGAGASREGAAAGGPQGTVRLGGGNGAGSNTICESGRTFQEQGHKRQSSSQRDRVSHAEQRVLSRGLSHGISCHEELVG